MQFIDVHGHYAWNIDDGIRSKEEAEEALQIARENGIIGIVATPHIMPGIHTQEDIKKIRQRIYELRVLAHQYQIGVFEGCELFLNDEYLDALKHHLFIPFENTQYLMVEFDVRKKIGTEYEVEERLYELQLQGYKPIIAHVERYFPDGINLKRVRDWVESGCVIQVNASSLLEVHGKTIKNNALQLIDHGLAHVVATDTHRSQGKRIPRMRQTFNVLSKKYDYRTVKQLLYKNPIHLLKNEEVEVISRKKSLFKKLFSER